MKCIKCEGQLLPVRAGDVEVDQCDSCHGIWFDSGELAKIVSASDVDALRRRAAHTKELEEKRRRADQQRASCPRCRGEGKLVQIASLTSDIHIDTCAVCGGQWLDGGELEIVREEGFSRKVSAFFRKILDI